MGAFWGTLLGCGGSCAVGDGQGSHHWQDGLLPDDRRGREARDRGQRGSAVHPIEEVDGPSAPKVQINNLDRLVNCSNEFLGRRDDRVYPVPIIRDEQAARNSSTAVDMSMDEENNKGGQPKP